MGLFMVKKEKIAYVSQCAIASKSAQRRRKELFTIRRHRKKGGKEKKKEKKYDCITIKNYCR